jgi:uncharacterized protein
MEYSTLGGSLIPSPPHDVILSFIGGSALHGAQQSTSTDVDYYGVYVEPPEISLGIDKEDHFVWSSAGTQVRNSHGDVDVCYYSLRRFAELCAKGNPTILSFLFAPNLLAGTSNAVTWQIVLDNRERLLAVSHYEKFIHYGRAQLARMKGERNLKVQRPELVEKYGYDTKFAMHSVRMMVECRDLLTVGAVQFPSSELELLLKIRNGEVTQQWVEDEVSRRIAECDELAKTCNVLPSTLDRKAIGDLLSEAYLTHWIHHNQL